MKKVKLLLFLVLFFFISLFLFSLECPQILSDYWEQLKWGNNFSDKEKLASIKSKFLDKVTEEKSSLDFSSWYKCWDELITQYKEALKDSFNFKTKEEDAQILEDVLNFWIFYYNYNELSFSRKFFYIWLEKIKIYGNLMEFYYYEKQDKNKFYLYRKLLEFYLKMAVFLTSRERIVLQDFLFNLWKDYCKTKNKEDLEKFDYFWARLFPFSTLDEFYRFTLRDPLLLKHLKDIYGKELKDIYLTREVEGGKR